MLEIIGGPDRDRTDDLFHAIGTRYLESITYNGVPELPSTCEYLKRKERRFWGWAGSWVEIWGESCPIAHDGRADER